MFYPSIFWGSYHFLDVELQTLLTSTNLSILRAPDCIKSTSAGDLVRNLEISNFLGGPNIEHAFLAPSYILFRWINHDIASFWCHFFWLIIIASSEKTLLADLPTWNKNRKKCDSSRWWLWKIPEQNIITKKQLEVNLSFFVKKLPRIWTQKSPVFGETSLVWVVFLLRTEDFWPVFAENRRFLTNLYIPGKRLVVNFVEG